MNIEVHGNKRQSTILKSFVLCLKKVLDACYIRIIIKLYLAILSSNSFQFTKSILKTFNRTAVYLCHNFTNLLIFSIFCFTTCMFAHEYNRIESASYHLCSFMVIKKYFLRISLFNNHNKSSLRITVDYSNTTH